MILEHILFNPCFHPLNLFPRHVLWYQAVHLIRSSIASLSENLSEYNAVAGKGKSTGDKTKQVQMELRK